MEKISNIQILDLKKIDISLYCEKSRDCSDVIPGQSFKIGELLERASRGQRLNVHMRPYEEEFTPKDTPLFTPGVDENFGDVPPQIDDITEFQEFAEQTKERRKEFEAKRKKTQQATKEPASPAANQESKEQKE